MAFELDQNRIEKIAEKFDVKKTDVERFHGLYRDKIMPLVENQYLAHLCRALEDYHREKGEHDSFTIRLKSIPTKKRCYGRVQYIKKREGKSPQYLVHFYDNIDVLKKRVIISHELGHILCALTLKNLKNSKFDPNDIEHAEPLSSLFGLFALMERAEFYKEKSPEYTHNNSFEELLNDFNVIYTGKKK